LGEGFLLFVGDQWVCGGNAVEVEVEVEVVEVIQ
jgi:hypothetical protein